MKLQSRLLYVFVIVMSSGFVTSCSKEKSVEIKNNSGGNGNPQTGTWQPMTKNSYWKYQTTGSTASENTMTSTGQKRTVSGIEYTVFNSVTTGLPAGEALFAIKDHNYYSHAQGVSPMGGSFDVSYLYLNDTASVGYTWNHVAGRGNGFTALTPGTIVEKGLSMTVEGKNYADVIHSRIDLQYDMLGAGIITFFTYDYYVAKNVGVIKIDATGDPILTNGFTSTTNLVDYSIK
jgi:hypothetical protein